MKYLILFIVFSFFLSNCSKSEDFDLEIINKSVISLYRNDKIFEKVMKGEKIEGSKTILVYKLTNKSQIPYYFSLKAFSGNKFSDVNQIDLDKAKARFYNAKGERVRVSFGIRCLDLENEKCNGFSRESESIPENLNYSIKGTDGIEKFINDNSNFIIYPKQSIYLEWFIDLPYANPNFNTYSVHFKEKEKYFMEVVMYSDSINYRKNISRTILKTIDDNNIKVYHGIVRSKNRIPVKFID